MGLALAVITTGTVFAQRPAEEPMLVKLDSGNVGGATVNDAIAFEGIPFAQPPVSGLRWHPPQPVKPWEGVREASAFNHGGR
jgi:para-nitrobenzyl esterase